MVKFQTFICCLCLIIVYSCSNQHNSENKNTISNSEKKYYDGRGVGPVKEIDIDLSINDDLVGAGEKIFNAKCTSCHQLNEERRIGPGLQGITMRRRPEWILNQILNPLEMTKNDSLAKELLSIYLSQMTPMNLTEPEARSVLEFLRKNDKSAI